MQRHVPSVTDCSHGPQLCLLVCQKPLVGATILYAKECHQLTQHHKKSYFPEMKVLHVHISQTICHKIVVRRCWSLTLSHVPLLRFVPLLSCTWVWTTSNTSTPVLAMGRNNSLSHERNCVLNPVVVCMGLGVLRHGRRINLVGGVYRHRRQALLLNHHHTSFVPTRSLC